MLFERFFSPFNARFLSKTGLWDDAKCAEISSDPPRGVLIGCPLVV